MAVPACRASDADGDCVPGLLVGWQRARMLKADSEGGSLRAAAVDRRDRLSPFKKTGFPACSPAPPLARLEQDAQGRLLITADSTKRRLEFRIAPPVGWHATKLCSRAAAPTPLATLVPARRAVPRRSPGTSRKRRSRPPRDAGCGRQCVASAAAAGPSGPLWPGQQPGTGGLGRGRPGSGAGPSLDSADQGGAGSRRGEVANGGGGGAGPRGGGTLRVGSPP